MKKFKADVEEQEMGSANCRKAMGGGSEKLLPTYSEKT